MTISRRYSLQSSALSIEVFPDEGGRISSLKSLHSGMEFLTQSDRSGSYPQPSFHAAFRDGPCAGIEECLPTVGACGPETDGGPVPDHGDFWQLRWNLTSVSSTHLHLLSTGFSRTLRFSKDVSLNDDTLSIVYRTENIGSTVQSFLYACHPLFAVSAGDLILLPAEVRELRLDYSRGNRIGGAGTAIAWPETQSGIRLDLASSPDSGTAEMFYTDRLSQGCCGIYRSATGQTLDIGFDPQRLPYLGLWLCYGGWPDGGPGPRQYAVALEPTTSGCNTLLEAQRNGSAVTLDIGETFQWEIRFRVRNSDSRPSSSPLGEVNRIYLSASRDGDPEAGGAAGD
jgi:galactose mutarotase-like enzyme